MRMIRRLNYSNHQNMEDKTKKKSVKGGRGIKHGQGRWKSSFPSGVVTVHILFCIPYIMSHSHQKTSQDTETNIYFKRLSQKNDNLKKKKIWWELVFDYVISTGMVKEVVGN